MKTLLHTKIATLASVLVFATAVVGCSKEDVKEDMVQAPTQEAGELAATTTSTTAEPGTTTTSTSTSSTTTLSTATFSRFVNFDARANGAYGYSQANQDFSSAIYYNTSNSQVYNKQLRTTLTKGVVGPSGGTMSRFDTPDGSEYQIQYSVMFGSNFEWSKGGKVGFGLLIGDGFTGGGSATSGTGGSARLMWFNNNGRVYLKPYLYHKDQPGTWGDDKAKTFPASGSIQKGTWYNVQMYVKSNTGWNTNGRIRIVINGVTLIDQAMRWTTYDTKRLINKVSFENFRGGSESYWASATDGDIFFDNVSFKQITK